MTDPKIPHAGDSAAPKPSPCPDDCLPAGGPPPLDTAVGVAAVRIHLGAILPNGRTAGHSDQCVHLVPVPADPVLPLHLRAYCGMILTPGIAEVVSSRSGPPCVACLLRSP